MKQILDGLVLFTLVACGGSGSSVNKGQEENPFEPCRRDSLKGLCIEPVNYIMNTRLTNFSKNMRMNVVFKNEETGQRRYTIVDTCLRRGDLKIISNATGSSIFFSHHPFLNAKSSLEIVDLGEDCKGSTVVIRTDLSEETFRVEGSSRTISVDLD